MNKLEKFQKLVSKDVNNTLARNKELIEKRAMLRESRAIALKVLTKLDELGWSQKDLAKKMDVSPQQVNKIVKGKENLTLVTQTKLQEILDIPILASYYETIFEKLASKVFDFINEIIIPKENIEFKETAVAKPTNIVKMYQPIIKMSFTA